MTFPVLVAFAGRFMGAVGTERKCTIPGFRNVFESAWAKVRSEGFGACFLGGDAYKMKDRNVPVCWRIAPAVQCVSACKIANRCGNQGKRGTENDRCCCVGRIAH